MKAFAVCLFLLVAPLFGSQPAQESRTHFVVADRARKPLFNVTTVYAQDDKAVTNALLARNVATGQKIVVSIHTDYQKHEQITQYLVDRKPVVTVRASLPFIATTVAGTLEERKNHRAELAAQDVQLSVECSGHAEHFTERGWQKGDKDALAKRANVHQAIDADVLTTLKNAAPLFAFPDFGAACASLPFVTDGATCQPNMNIMFATVLPDCSFDADMGMPCGADHLAKAQAARASGKARHY
jgi:hypothetical protein